eukprot:1183871-Prorocentrum_minimum.AAC.5
MGQKNKFPHARYFATFKVCNTPKQPARARAFLALDDTAIVTSDGVEGILLVAAHFLNVVAALLTHVAVQAEVRCTAHHHLLELGLALRGEIGLLAVFLETHLRTAHARLHICTELLLVLAAQTQQGGVEAQVVRVLDLLVA